MILDKFIIAMTTLIDRNARIWNQHSFIYFLILVSPCLHGPFWVDVLKALKPFAWSLNTYFQCLHNFARRHWALIASGLQRAPYIFKRGGQGCFSRHRGVAWLQGFGPSRIPWCSQGGPHGPPSTGRRAPSSSHSSPTGRPSLLVGFSIIWTGFYFYLLAFQRLYFNIFLQHLFGVLWRFVLNPPMM